MLIVIAALLAGLLWVNVIAKNNLAKGERDLYERRMLAYEQKIERLQNRLASKTNRNEYPFHE